MLLSELIQSNGKRRGQALAEFALTALVFLLVMVLVIEVAHIMQAFVTIQHAARSGARYAVTGQWFEKYAIQPLAGWDAGSDNALHHIPPCWPRFDDDDYAPTLPSFDFYEPYRDARTCSVEEVTLTALAGLTLDPDAAADQPSYYEVVVSGVSEDRDPTDGTFVRDGATEQYSHFYPAISPYNQPNIGLVRGFAGRPEQKVVVQVKYRVKVITPLLNSIARSVELTSTAVMVNETFGNIGLQREPILPPEPVPVPPLEPPQPPNLVVTEFQLLSPTPLDVGSDTEFEITIQNIGELFILASDAFDLTLYYSATELVEESPLIGGTPLTDGSTHVDVDDFGETGLRAGETLTLTIDTAEFPEGGTFYVYAWVDSGNTIDEENSPVPGGPTFPDWEKDNVMVLPVTVEVTQVIDLEVDKTVDNTAPTEGDTVTYTITVENINYGDATGVQVTDLLPAGVTYVSHTVIPITTTYNVGAGVWDIGELLSGDTATLEIVATADAVVNPTNVTNKAEVTAADQIDIDSTPNNNDPGEDDQVSVLITVYPTGAVYSDLELTKHVTPSEVEEGDTVTYTLTLRNYGPEDATGVEVTDILPAGVTYVSDDGAYDSGTGVWTVGDLATGANVQLHIDATVDEGTAGSTITNKAEVTAADQDDNDSTPNNNNPAEDDQDSDSFEVAAADSCDLQVTKVVDNEVPVEGSQIVYTVKVLNKGPDQATGVTLEDVLPSGVTYVFHAATGGTTYDDGTGVWDVGTLDVNEEETLNITMQVDIGTSGDVITNTASVDSLDQVDPVSSNNSDFVAISVSGSADLEIEKTVDTDVAGPGDVVTYTITVTNNGPGAAADIRVLDADLSDAATPPDQHLNVQLPVVVSAGTADITTGEWVIPTLLVGQSETLEITAAVITVPEGGLLENRVEITSAVPSYDPDITNNYDIVVLHITWPQAIFINVGNQWDGGCNDVVTWGATEDQGILGQDYDWQVNQPYTPGSWGYRGRNYYRRGPSSSDWVIVDDGNNLLNQDGQSLLGCRMYGEDFKYTFDEMYAGLYRVVLGFADPFRDPYQRRFDVQAISGPLIQPLLTNFDINLWIRDVLGLDPPRIPGGWWNPDRIHYGFQEFTVEVGGVGQLEIQFIGEKTGGSYFDENAMIQAIGVEFVSVIP
jgi:uncharacterized repeat protein (TIGR01451 family)